ncbi:MAG: PEP-CTERM sorting domain-containing protein [Okeania sp. SIO3B5]|uniref:PEP-CTERM sorting domain-containing protein n=1 Tax=Okeania sp. SIO3B5 TaxID=2607811 RepID=UPI001400DB61|nr:PEP-CTERM sorting domain-containing protein [Okeania sp. SIO3B5]NEO58416.1 PEP-CTERM sorting domain-containing protein [Okeania sp. SIO3B5]
MLLKTLTKLALGTAISSIGFMVTNTPTQAALLGDTIGTRFQTTNPAIDLSHNVSVTSDIEINYNLIDMFSIDIDSESFDIKYTGGLGSFISGNTKWTLSDLDWVDPLGFITDVTLTSGDEDLVHDISFTDNSIMIELLDANLSPGVTQTWSFDIQAKYESTPEPATILGLLTVTGLGLGSRLKRNVG